MAEEELNECYARIADLEKGLYQRDQDIKILLDERKVLEELSTVTVSRKDGDASRGVLPEDSLDLIVKLENTVKLEKHKTEAANKERRMLDVQLKKTEKEYEKLAIELHEVKSETGWTKGSKYKQRTSAAESKSGENKVRELTQIIQRLEEEQRTNKQIERKKTQLIETLSKELDGKKDSEENLYQAQNTIKVKDREIKDLTEELKTLKRIHAKKDKLILTMETEKDELPIKTLEGDKRFLQSEISKHMEIRRQQERTIKAQQFRVDQLEARIEGISRALKDMKMDRHMSEALKGPVTPNDSTDKDLNELDQIVPEKEAVDIELYELLQRDLDGLRHALGLKEVIIQEKDANVEALEKKVDILAHAKRTENRAIVAERKEYTWKIDDLNQALEVQTENFRRQIDRVKAENARLRAKLFKLGDS